jgi:hypothetical protein
MLPKTLVADNDQVFMRKELKDLYSRIGINLEPNPKQSPRLKGQIERFFKITNTSIIRGLPGTSPSNEEGED